MGASLLVHEFLILFLTVIAYFKFPIYCKGISGPAILNTAVISRYSRGRQKCDENMPLKALKSSDRDILGKLDSKVTLTNKF